MSATSRNSNGVDPFSNETPSRVPAGVPSSLRFAAIASYLFARSSGTWLVESVGAPPLERPAWNGRGCCKDVCPYVWSINFAGLIQVSPHLRASLSTRETSLLFSGLFRRSTPVKQCNKVVE